MTFHLVQFKPRSRPQKTPEFCPLHSNLVQFKLRNSSGNFTEIQFFTFQSGTIQAPFRSILPPFSQLLYIPIWYNSSLTPDELEQMKAALYIPIWYNSSRQSFQSSDSESSLYIPIWYNSSKFITGLPSRALQLYIPIWYNSSSALPLYES